MKKFINVLNPFVLLLVPVMVAVVLGIRYEFQQQQEALAHLQASEQAVPLFYKGLEVFKAVCAITKDNVW